MAVRKYTSMMEFFAVFILFVSFITCFSEEREIYLVLMEGNSVAFHGNGSRIHPNNKVWKGHAEELVDFHDQILQKSLENETYTKLYSFTHIINGFAVHTTPCQAKKLRDREGVRMVERDRGVRMMTTYTPEFLGLPKGVWKQQGGEDGYSGEGIVIGFVDSGIDPTHPSFANFDPLFQNPNSSSKFCGGYCEKGPLFPASSCNGKIISAKYFSAGAQAAATLNSSLDFLSPFDAQGHGSHVASIAAGNAGIPVVVNGFFYGFASGMAPRARIAVYKAVYPTVGTLADVVSAIDQAAIDGVDILALSIGPNEPPEVGFTFLSIFDISILSAIRAGIFVVQAAGNLGPASSTVISYSPWAVSAAASGTDRVYPASLLLGNGHRVAGVGLSAPTLGSGFLLYKLVLAKDAVKRNGAYPRTPQYIEECQYPEVFDPKVVRNSIIICTFSDGFYKGTSTLTAIVDTATKLRFMGFILIANPKYGDFIAEPIPFRVPGIFILRVAKSQAILKYYEENTCRDVRGRVTKFKAKAAMGEGRFASFGGEAPTVSRFSSRGPDYMDRNRTPADVLKPDILAPGHQVWAAWSPLSASEPILKGYRFSLLSGTSMATPHIAGIAALIKQKNPSWSPSMIASAMSTTATKYNRNGELIRAEGFDIDSSYPSTPFDLGAGLVSPANALDPGVVFSSEYEDYIKFLCSLPGIDPAVVKNTTGEQCNGLLQQSHPANLNLPSVTIASLVGQQSVQRTVKNVGGKVETYVGSVIPPNGTIVNVNPPWFTIAPEGVQNLEIQINVAHKMDHFSFGEIILTGSLNHIARIPLSVMAVSVS